MPVDMNVTETGNYGGVPYVRVGRGAETIVVINGGNAFVQRLAPHSAARNARQIARLFPEDSTLIVLGYDTAAPPPYDVDAIAGELAEVIRTHHGAVSLAAISFGGFVATRLAAAHPDLVRRLILISTAHRFSEEGRQRTRDQIAAVTRGDFMAMTRPFLTLFRSRWRNLLIRTAMRLSRRPLAERMNEPDYITGMLEAALAADRSNPSHLQQVRADTLLLGGTRDQFFDPVALQETADLLRSAKVVLFPEETHTLLLERPGAVAKAIGSFLRGS